MEVIDFKSTDKGYKHSVRKARTSYKISLDNESILAVSLGKPGRGGQGLGRKYRVREFYIDPENRILAGYIAKDRTGQYYQYAIIGRLEVQVLEEVLKR
jgi:hypothetical protein